MCINVCGQVHLLGRICDWRGWGGHFERLRRLVGAGRSEGVGPIFALAYPLDDPLMCRVVTQVPARPRPHAHAHAHARSKSGGWSRGRAE